MHEEQRRHDWSLDYTPEGWQAKPLPVRLACRRAVPAIDSGHEKPTTEQLIQDPLSIHVVQDNRPRLTPLEIEVMV